MVDALLFENLERTLAALPVGANSNGFLFTEYKLFTNAEIKLVLPVPAYPFRRKIFLVLIDKMKSDNC